MTKTNFSANTDANLPRQRNIHRKKAPAGFAEILDQQPVRREPPRPSATVKPKTKANPGYESSPESFGKLEDLRGPTGTVIAEMELRSPLEAGEESIGDKMRKETLPYARTRGTFVRVPTFSDLGRDAVEPEQPETTTDFERPEASPQFTDFGSIAQIHDLESRREFESLRELQSHNQPASDDPWLPPAPTWGQSRGPDPELVQTPPEEDALAMANQFVDAEADSSGELALFQALGWESLDPEAEPMVDLEHPVGPFEVALSIEDDASPIDVDAANFAPMADFGGGDTPEHSASFLSAVPSVTPETSATYGTDGHMLTAADPEGPVARNVEVFRTALNRAAITVDTDDGQIELAITTAGKHVMVEATAAGGFTDAIQRDLDALRSALDRHDLELTELSFDESRAGSEDNRQSREAAPEAPRSLHPTSDGGDADVGFSDDGRQTWVIPTGFKVVA